MLLGHGLTFNMLIYNFLSDPLRHNLLWSMIGVVHFSSFKQADGLVASWKACDAV